MNLKDFTILCIVRYRSARRTTFQQIDASLLAEVVDLIGALPGQTVLLSR